jgi:N4-gp56 family major capsid protein
MAETVLNSENAVQRWLSQYLQEYVRESGFEPYMGTGLNRIIVVNRTLVGEAGHIINIPLIRRLKGAGVTGNQTLEGNEEDLSNLNCPISVDWLRNAVKVSKGQSYKTPIDLLAAARVGLRTWSSEKMRDEIIQAFGAVVTTGNTTVNYLTASEANKDAWLTANQDRILFGATRSNGSSNDHSTALGNVATPADRASTAILSLAKRMAKNADPHIRPFRTDAGREYFVAFHGSRTFRDMKELNPTSNPLALANRESRERNAETNPIFQDGDLIYDGVIHREVPEIDDYFANTGGLNGVGNTSADVRPIFVCGQQAVGVAYGQDPAVIVDQLSDYRFKPGVAIEELRGIKKMAYDGKQHGMVTVYCAAPADA